MFKMTPPTTTATRGSGRARRMLLALLVVGAAMAVVPSLSSGAALTWTDGTTAPKSFSASLTAVGTPSTFNVVARCKAGSVGVLESCGSTQSFPAGSNPPFSVATTGCASTIGTVSFGQSKDCTISVRFSPTVFGVSTGTMNIAGLQANLSGQATRLLGADASFLTTASSTTKQTSFNLGTVAQTQPVTSTFTLYNTGNTPLTGVNATSTANFTGANAADFQILPGGNTCPASLAVMASCTISVTATPSIIGSESATLTTSGSATTTLALTVAGAAPVYGAELRDSTGTTTHPVTDFGNVTPPTLPSYSYRLYNTGNVPVAGTGGDSIKFTGLGRGAFSQTNDCPATLNPGLFCTITVAVNASDFEDQTAQLEVATTTAGATVAPSSLHANLTGAYVANNTTDATTGAKRWLDTLTIGDATNAGEAVGSPNTEVRVGLDVPHSTGYRPTTLQVSGNSTSGTTAPTTGWSDVPTTVNQLPGSNRRTYVSAAFNAGSVGWAGGTTTGNGTTTSLAGYTIPNSACSSQGVGTVANRYMWFRVRDGAFSYSAPFATPVRATRTTWHETSRDNSSLDVIGISVTIGDPGDCAQAPPGIVERGITSIARTSGTETTPLADHKQDAVINTTTPVSFSFAGHGGRWNQSCTYGLLGQIGFCGRIALMNGVNWRLRNSVTGQIVNKGLMSWGDTADGTVHTVTVPTWPSRGRWVVEGSPTGDNNTSDPNSWNFIGSVNVNADAPPTVTLTGLPGDGRVKTDTAYTLAANASDVDPFLSGIDPVGGKPTVVEWDIDNDHTNGPGGDGYESRFEGNPYAGLAASQLQKAFNTTGKTPGPYEICVRVTDNGSFSGTDPAGRTTEACKDIVINHPPVADDKTVDIEADDLPALENIPLTATDADGDPWNITVANQTQAGSVTDGAGDTADYTWPSTFAGTDQFTFVAHDDHDGSGNGQLTVNVHPATTLDDTQAPHGTGPTNASQTRGATFTFTSPQQATNVNGFECQLSTDPDGGTDFEVAEGEEWAPCSAGTKVYSSLDDGTYKVEVRAVTSGGLKDLTPATYTWRVDTTKPEVVYHGTENAGPGGVLFTNDTTPSYTLTATDQSPQEADTYECRFPAGSGPWVACGDPVGSSGSSPVDLVGPLFGITDPLEEGQYQIEARATDEAGNLGDAFTRSFTVDTTPPVTSIVSGPEGLINTRDITYAVISNEAGSSFVCQLGERATEPDTDPSNWVPCPGTNGAPAYTGLADGLYTFFVKAVDPAGNVAIDDPVESTDFEVDATAPETIVGELHDGDNVLLTGSEPSTQTRKATITFDGTDNRLLHGYECRLDSSASDAWQTCQSPETYGGLADGHHKIEVQAVDDAQNRDQTPIVYEWYVDRTPPATTFDDHPGAYDNDPSPTVTWHATDNVSTGGFTYECSVDESTWATCDTPLDVAVAAGQPLADGPHTLAVRATDPAGNLEATAATLSWVVDTVAPAIELTAHPTASISPAGPADFGFRALDGSPLAAAPELTTECAVDEDLSTDPTGWTWTTCTSPHTIAAPSDGHHTFAVRSLDPAGNASVPATHEWDVDATPPPAPRIDSSTPRDGVLTAATDATVAFSLEDEDHITYQCRLDGAPWQDCPDVDNAGGGQSQSPYTVTGLDDGAHQIDIRAIDEVGNVSPVSSLSWTVDHNLPSTHIDAGPSGTVRSAQATFSFSSNTAGNTFECRVDGAAWEACATPLALTDLSEGAHSLSVRAVKGGVAPVGLKDPTPQTRAWTVDTTAPVLTVGDKPAESSTETKAKFTFSADDATAVFQCALDAGDFDTCSSPLERTVVPGSHALKIRAVDAAGNASATETVTWAVTEEVAPESGHWLATLTAGTLAFQGLGAVPVPAGSLKLSGDLNNGAWHVGRGGVIVDPIVQNVDITPGATAALKITLSALQDASGTLPADLGDGSASFDISLQVQVSAMLGALPIITDAQNCTVGPLDLQGVGTYTKATQTIHIEDNDVHVPAAGLGCGTWGGTVNGLLHLPADGNAASFDFKLEKSEEQPQPTTTQQQPPPNPPVTKTVETQTPHIVTPPAVPSLGTVSTKVPSNGKVKVPVWCVGRTTQVCAGTVSLAAKVGKKTTTLGKATYSVQGGKSKTVTVKLSKAALKSLKTAKKGLKATLTVAPKTTAKIAKSVTLRRATSVSKGGQK